MSGFSIRLMTTIFWRAWYRLHFFADLPGLARLLHYRKLRERYYRSLWESVAENLQADISHDYFGYSRISRNGLVTFVKLYNVMLEDHLMLKVMGNKALTYSLLSEMGFPLARHRLFSMQNLEVAEAFLQNEKTVVVKPSSGTGGGRGVTTGIHSISQLTSAARVAARFGDTLIVEEQLQGASFRLLYLDGEFIDAIRRDPPVVTGDGLNTIRKLVGQENARRKNQMPFTALSPLVLDKDARNWMRETGLSLGTIPAIGEVVQIKRAINENDRNSNVNVTKRIHKDITGKCGELVRRLGAKFVGVDLICKDITQPFDPKNCRISEVNTTPGLHHHYLVSNLQEANPVAEILIEYMFSNHVGVMEIGDTNKQADRTGKNQRQPVGNNNTAHFQQSGGLIRPDEEVFHEHQ
jgi:D-alanine-D-alanine ligase-like ATP-grasp enzyme